MNIISLKEYKNIFACDRFLNEKDELYRKNPKDKTGYAKWLDRQLGFLDTTGLRVLQTHSAAFEKLTGVEEGIYSITRREFSGNPRVLFFSILEDGEPDTFVLLAAFKELSAGDYKRYISVAKERRKVVLEILKEDEDNESEE